MMSAQRANGTRRRRAYHQAASVPVAIPLGFVVQTGRMPAGAVLALRLVLQLLSNLFASGEGGVAFFAHIGGFVTGLLLSLALVGPRSLAAYRSAQRRDLHSRYRWF